MNSIKVIIANGNYLVGRALTLLVDELQDFEVLKWVENQELLCNAIKVADVDVVMIDFTSEGFNLSAIQWIKRNFPKIQILSITELPQKEIILTALNAGVKSYILNDCGKEEIIEAIYKTATGNDFMCGKVLGQLELKENDITYTNQSCEGISLTERELDIVKLIAEGHSNKQIAEILFLSTHTINTHRKNIMYKLGVNNTAGLVMYAVKENLLGPNKFLFSAQ
jgi:DNA-binding NarL/FixJ family response regulator